MALNGFRDGLPPVPTSTWFVVSSDSVNELRMSVSVSRASWTPAPKRSRLSPPRSAVRFSDGSTSL